MHRFVLLAVVLFSLTLAQNIKWTGLEGGWIELLNTNFDGNEASNFFRPSTGQRVRTLTCGSEGGSISPSGPRGTLTWTIGGTPTFNEIYVKIRFGFIDSWESEEAWVTVNGVRIWSQISTTDQGNHNIHVCGRTSRTDELVTIERRLRLSAPATSLTIVIGSNLDQEVDNEFFIVSEFMVYAHGPAGAPAPTGANAGNNQQQQQNQGWQNIYTSAFAANTPSGWVDNANRAIIPYTCGTEGLTLRQGINNYLQWQSPAIGFNYNRARVSLRLGFLDSWDGEAAIITVNGQEIWRQTSTAPAANANQQTIQASGHTSNVCADGSRPPRSNDRFVDVAQEVSLVPTNDRRITVRVYSTLDQDIENESFVISNIRVDALRQ
jgi:hypothetical protein